MKFLKIHNLERFAFALTGPSDNEGAGPTAEEKEAEGGVGQSSGGSIACVI